MNNSEKPLIKYLADYQPPAFLIETIDLIVELFQEQTIVTSQLAVIKNPQSLSKDKDIILDGEAQQLVSIQLNGNELTEGEYQVTPKHLSIFDVPTNFRLEIKTIIKPQENTLLSGLYRSNDLFCTQCESEGFRRITYFIDRPDVLSRYTTTIIADQKKYPVLLSNGNLIDSGEMSDGLHWMKWEDPYPKPCYLFALVAGDLDYIEDYHTTSSNRTVTLRIFVESGFTEQANYAMEALKKAMKWDEEKYGREYDLDLYMIVAVHDFNFGAMENKGLNIFNAKYIFADPKTATDTDYENIDIVVAHEYFHNWTGNRVTCRDWFQLCLKEGLTVFRDQQFSADVSSKALRRIKEVETLREFQFAEDSGPLSHSVRPDAYLEISNFYTHTVYRKGAEVIRMLYTLLGEKGFRQGLDIYFHRHDGYAVTCEDFILAMEEANHQDLSQFKLWLTQSGTPTLYLASKYSAEKKEWYLLVTQHTKPTKSQPEKQPLFMPFSIALFDHLGKEMPLIQSHGEEDGVLKISKEETEFRFSNINEKPIPSFLREFSAPVHYEYPYGEEEFAFLMAHDTDAFVRYESSQSFARKVILSLIFKSQNIISKSYSDAFEKVLSDELLDKALMAKLITLPSENYLASFIPKADPDQIHEARQLMMKELSRTFFEKLLTVYKNNRSEKPYKYSVIDSAERALKNTCLNYLLQQSSKDMFKLSLKQFYDADNMTDKMAALFALNDHECEEREEALREFYQTHKDNPLALDKWFSLQATSTRQNTFSVVKGLMTMPEFHIKNPNRVYALIYSFVKHNPVRFHQKDGEVYEWLADQIIMIDAFNPHVAARLIEPLTLFKNYEDKRSALMKEALIRISTMQKPSKDIFEIVEKSLAE